MLNTEKKEASPSRTEAKTIEESPKKSVPTTPAKATPAKATQDGQVESTPKKSKKLEKTRLPRDNLRRQLIKRLASYYIVLMETEDLDPAYKIGASSDYYDIANSELNLLESDLNKFDELKERRGKIHELRNLMYAELHQMKNGFH